MVPELFVEEIHLVVEDFDWHKHYTFIKLAPASVLVNAVIVLLDDVLVGVGIWGAPYSVVHKEWQENEIVIEVLGELGVCSTASLLLL